jgi:hypothetical protein
LSLPNIVRVIKSRRMRWARHVAHMGEVGNAYSLIKESEGKRPIGRLGVNRWVILKRILKK